MGTDDDELMDWLDVKIESGKGKGSSLPLTICKNWELDKILISD
jgi:hypothetical protein